jgi:uncharacterized protein
MTKLSNNDKVESFKDVQNVFTQHMRDPENNPAPKGVEDRRIGVYRELVFNNIESFIANSFPILRKITADEQWHEMLRDYVSHHKAHTPLFPKMPQEFIQYLEHERGEHSEDAPFLLELAHYEWIETALSIDTREIDFSNVEQEGDLLEGIPVLSPLSIALAYAWPVHEISPTNLPDIPPNEKTYIVVYRQQDDEVGFMVLNPVSAKLIEYLQTDEELTGREILMKIVNELNHPNSETVIQGGLDIMQGFLKKNILLGVKA